MKELSIEEKAKAYDEAIEKLRSLHDDYDTVSTLIDVKEELENIFPELAESEDKRVREKVIDVLKLNVRGAESQMQASRGVDRTFEVYACNKVIAWLEKKPSLLTKEKALKNSPFVEQKPVWSEEDEDYRLNANVAFDDYFEKEYAGALRNWLKSIKERCTWKPSDEQMKRLKGTIDSLPNQEVLYSLYQDLKKLREE